MRCVAHLKLVARTTDPTELWESNMTTRKLRILAGIGYGIILCIATGCQSQLDHLRKEVRLIREEAGELDSTVKVFAVFAPEKPPNHALGALNEPESLYLATFRFVTAIITPSQVTLHYRGLARSYALPPRRYYYTGYYSFFFGWQTAYFLGGRDILAKQIVGDHKNSDEVVVVTDPQLHPIESEKPAQPLPKEYPTLLRKYGHFSQEEYEAWLQTKPQTTVEQDG